MALLNALNLQFVTNNLIYASGPNTLTGLATANNGVLITSGEGIPSISSTLPIAVQTNITELGTITTGIWNGSILAGTYGGTGINNGIKTITLGGNLTTSGAFASTFTMTGNTTVTFPTTGTLATTAGVINSITGTALQIDVTAGVNPVISIDAGYLGQASITTLGTIGTGTWAGTNVALNHGGTNAALVASNGGIFYSTATAGAVLAGTATAGQLLTSGASTTPAWTTSTYPATNAANTLLYASSANTMAALATGNNGVLITSGAGVPSISSTLPAAVQGNITATGALASGSLAAGFTPVTVPLGGTGNTTFTAYSIICAGTTATGTFQNVVGVGTAGQVLQSNGASALPSWAAGGASGGLQSFTILTSGTAQTYTTPAGVVNIMVEMIGGGGGGGGVSGGAGGLSAGGGGGAGGYLRKFITGASATYTYTVGAGGNGGASGNNAGSNGTDSTFSTLTASHGVGGGGGASSGSTSINASGAGGTATNGDINITGQTGGEGVGIAIAANTATFSGIGGSTTYGAGGTAVSANSGTVTGINGAGYGSGGSGGTSALNASGAAGGNGMGGIIIVWEFS